MVPEKPYYQDDAGPEKIIWRVHPLAENVWRSLLLGLIIAATGIGAYQWTGWPGMGLFAVVLLVVSMAPYIFPTNYEMDADGIEIRFIGVKRFREWAEFRNFLPHHDGVHLSTFKRPNAMEAFRGSYIRYNRTNRKDVLQFLERHIKKGDKKDSVTEQAGDKGLKE